MKLLVSCIDLADFSLLVPESKILPFDSEHIRGGGVYLMPLLAGEVWQK